MLLPNHLAFCWYQHGATAIINTLNDKAAPNAVAGADLRRAATAKAYPCSSSINGAIRLMQKRPQLTVAGMDKDDSITDNRARQRRLRPSSAML